MRQAPVASRQAQGTFAGYVDRIRIERFDQACRFPARIDRQTQMGVGRAANRRELIRRDDLDLVPVLP